MNQDEFDYLNMDSLDDAESVKFPADMDRIKSAVKRYEKVMGNRVSFPKKQQDLAVYQEGFHLETTGAKKSPSVKTLKEERDPEAELFSALKGLKRNNEPELSLEGME